MNIRVFAFKSGKTSVLISVCEIIIKQRRVVIACLQANTSPLFLFPKFPTMAMAWLMNI